MDGKLVECFAHQVFHTGFVHADPHPGNSKSVILLYLEFSKGVVTNYGEGGATKREGGAREVLPLRKGGAEKVLAILKGGAQKVLG